MNGEPDDRHLHYCIARPGAFRNVGWSLANELDCMSNLDGKHPGRKAWSASRKASTSAALSNKGGFPAAKSAEPDAPKADSDQDDAGFWSIPPGGRNLIHADGRARLLCADTAWALPWRATVEQAETQARGTSLDVPRASRVYDPRSGAEVGKGRLPDKAPVPFNGGLSSAPRVVVFAAATP